MKLLISIGLVALALSLGACGGDDGDEAPSANAEDQATKTDGASGAEGGSSDSEDAPGDTATTAAGPKPEGLFRCLRRAGYEASIIPPPPEGEPGSELGALGIVRMQAGAANNVVAVFFDSAKQAKEALTLRESVQGSQGSPEVVSGTVFIAADQGSPPELQTLKTCLR